MDRRDIQAHYGNWWDKFDEKRMVLIVEDRVDVFYPDCENCEEHEHPDVEFPAHYEVCDLCDGKGHHVNPSIDAHGISGEEFYDDPEFAEEYMSGRYDVACYACGGKRVVPCVAENLLNEEGKRLLRCLDDMLKSRADSIREDEYCQRMGF